MMSRRADWVWGMVLVIGALSSGCRSSSDDNPFPSVLPAGKCAGVWSSTRGQCIIDSNCTGFGCLYILPYCKARADQALVHCCATYFSNNSSDRQTCLDTLGDSP